MRARSDQAFGEFVDVHSRSGRDWILWHETSHRLDRLPHAFAAPLGTRGTQQNLYRCLELRRGDRVERLGKALVEPVSGIAPSLIDARQRPLPRHERCQAPSCCIKDGSAVARHFAEGSAGESERR